MKKSAHMAGHASPGSYGDSYLTGVLSLKYADPLLNHHSTSPKPLSRESSSVHSTLSQSVTVVDAIHVDDSSNVLVLEAANGTDKNAATRVSPRKVALASGLRVFPFDKLTSVDASVLCHTLHSIPADYPPSTQTM